MAFYIKFYLLRKETFSPLSFLQTGYFDSNFYELQLQHQQQMPAAWKQKTLPFWEKQLQEDSCKYRFC